MQSEDDVPIPVSRPLLPDADSLLPYLKTLDASRTYANFGALSVALGERLAAALDVEPDGVVMAASGTAGLIAAILATATPSQARPYAIIPAFTFVGTASAVERCGFIPWLADVDPASWALDPARLRDLDILDKVGLVMPVAPFGRDLDLDAWQAFSDASGIAVVIDAAAGLARRLDRPGGRIGRLPVVFSLHATKGFGIGEGGCVATRDVDLAGRILAALNFGFNGSRDSLCASFNGKLSEYHAAVGMAALDQWLARLAALQTVTQTYRRLFAPLAGKGELSLFPEVDAGYALLLCPSDDAAAHLRRELDKAAIGHRQWYGTGIQAHPHFANLPREDLGYTAALGQRLVGLPMFPDLDPASLWRITAAVVA